MTIRVVVADDHPVVRAGVVMMLNADPKIEVLGQASNGLEAVELARDLDPDLVVMDLQMPELDGVEATRRIRSELTTVQVLLLTTYDTDRAIVSAIEAGAAGYLLKDAPPGELVQAVHTAASGRQVLAPVVAEKLQAHRDAPPMEDLTSRELEVLTALAQGGTNRGIAESLFISQATVKTHLTHIFQKLRVEDRTSAVARAVELGIVER